MEVTAYVKDSRSGLLMTTVVKRQLDLQLRTLKWEIPQLVVKGLSQPLP
jgi:hypothetical protein